MMGRLRSSLGETEAEHKVWKAEAGEGGEGCKGSGRDGRWLNYKGTGIAWTVGRRLAAVRLH